MDLGVRPGAVSEGISVVDERTVTAMTDFAAVSTGRSGRIQASSKPAAARAISDSRGITRHPANAWAKGTHCVLFVRFYTLLSGLASGRAKLIKEAEA